MNHFVGFAINCIDGSVRNRLMAQSEVQFLNQPLQIDRRFQSIPIEHSDSEACQTVCSFSAADREFHEVSAPLSS